MSILIIEAKMPLSALGIDQERLKKG